MSALGGTNWRNQDKILRTGTRGLPLPATIRRTRRSGRPKSVLSSPINETLQLRLAADFLLCAYNESVHSASSFLSMTSAFSLGRIGRLFGCLDNSCQRADEVTGEREDTVVDVWGDFAGVGIGVADHLELGVEVVDVVEGEGFRGAG